MARKDRNAVVDVKSVLAESADPIREVVQATLQQILECEMDELLQARRAIRPLA